MKSVIAVVVVCLVAWAHSLPASTSPTEKPTTASEPATSPDSEDTFEEEHEESEISRKLEILCSAVCPALDCLEAEANVEKRGCDCRSCDLNELVHQDQISKRSATSTDLANDRAPGREKRGWFSRKVTWGDVLFVAAAVVILGKRSVDPANEPGYISNNEQVNSRSNSYR